MGANLLGVVIALICLHYGDALQCWRCSSDIEPACRDPFNFTNYIGGGGYNNYGSQGYQSDYDRNRQYDSQYDRNYDRNYDPNYQRGYNRPAQQFSGRTYPQLVTCDDNEANLRRMKNICYKRKQTNANGYTTIIRRCETVPLDTYAGTCYDPVQRGISVDFCEYCDYDGCNSATGLKITYLTVLITLIVSLILPKL